MCNNSGILIIFLIVKIIILALIPIILFILYRRDNKLFNFIGMLDAVLIIVFIILKLFNNPCVNNSNFFYIKSNEVDLDYISENTNTLYESVYSTDKYFYQDNRNAYYYDINTAPLKNVSLSCNKKSYMEHYGNGISAITTLIANYYDIDINIVDVLAFLEDKNLIDCNNGIDFNKAFISLGEMYNYRVKEIYSSQIDSYISNGRSVLVETTNKANETNNFGCEKDYIVIYNKTNEGTYNIINPNDQYESYFCPSNTIGYSSIIEGNQNEKSYTIDNINAKALRYFVIEVE